MGRESRKIDKTHKAIMKISIIIATWNAAKTLRRCLDSIVSQLTDETELILIDGGSKDETNEIIDSYGDKIAVHVSEPDKGVYDAWNKGVRVAKGDWITFIGADDWMLPDTISKYLGFFNDNGEDYDLICAKLHFVNSKGEVIRDVGEPWNWKKLIHRSWNLAHPGMLHNRRCFERIGCFDTRYRICGDSDFLQRLGPDIKTAFISDFLINMSEGGISDSTAAVKEGYVSRKRNKVLPDWVNLLEYSRLVVKVILGRLKRKL